MFLVDGNISEYNAAKSLTVTEYLTKLEFKVKEQKRKEKEDGR